MKNSIIPEKGYLQFRRNIIEWYSRMMNSGKAYGG
jgi:hypothetical protein